MNVIKREGKARWKLRFGTIMAVLFTFVVLLGYQNSVPARGGERGFPDPQKALAYGQESMDCESTDERVVESSVVWEGPLREREGILYLIQKTLENQEGDRRVTAAFYSVVLDKNLEYHWDKTTADFALGGVEWDGGQQEYVAWGIDIDQYTLLFGRMLRKDKALQYWGTEIGLGTNRAFGFPVSPEEKTRAYFTVGDGE